MIVVGDGEGAHERARRLHAAGAEVEMTAPADYDPERLHGAFLALGQSDDAELDERVARDARAAGCLAYAHDRPDLSDLAMPALIRRGPLAIAISTDAAAPALSRRLRQQLESLLEGAGEALDRLVSEMEAARAKLPKGGRGQPLRQMAARLHLRGTVEIDE